MSRRVAARDNSRYGAAATAAPVLTASARPRRRRAKVFSQVFFKKLARCGAELHGLNRRSRWKRSSGRGACCEADSPGSGRGGTLLALSTSKNPGRGGKTIGGHTSPLFLEYGKAGRWCPVGTVQRRPRRQPRTTVLATPLRPWSSAPHLASFLKKT